MAACRICGLATMLILLFVFFGLLLFACIHWQNGWSAFVLVPCVFAFFVPPICFGYQPAATLHLQDTEQDEQTFHSCRELGWVIAAMLLMGAYGIPVLTWYNDHFDWRGVECVFGALTALVWAFVIWLRIFAFR